MEKERPADESRDQKKADRRQHKRRTAVNRMQFIGRLGQDIELRKTEQGTSVIEFSLADTEKYKDQEKTTWLRCVAWSGIADTIQRYVRKGDKIYVDGKYRHEEYTNKEGQKRYKDYLLVAGFEFLPNSRQEKQEQAEPMPEKKQDTVRSFEDEGYEQFGWF